MSDSKHSRGSRFRDALAIVDPGASNASGIALSMAEACREMCEHVPTASFAHDPTIRLMVYQLASVVGVADYAIARYTTDEAACIGLSRLTQAEALRTQLTNDDSC